MYNVQLALYMLQDTRTSARLYCSVRSVVCVGECSSAAMTILFTWDGHIEQ